MLSPDPHTVDDTEQAVAITFPSRSEHIALVRQALSAMGEVGRWDQGFIADVKVAASEACGNSIAHAYGEDEGEVRVRVALGTDRLVIRVADDGMGISPRPSQRPGLGLGIPLLARIADRLEIASTPGCPTEVAMHFIIRREVE